MYSQRWSPYGVSAANHRPTDAPLWNPPSFIQPDLNMASDQFGRSEQEGDISYSYHIARDRPSSQFPPPTTFDDPALPTTVPNELLFVGGEGVSSRAGPSQAQQPKQSLNGKSGRSRRVFDWESHKEVMHDFYMKQDKPLTELRKFMKDNFNFEATPKQFKLQFDAWDWVKKLPHQYAVFMDDKVKRRQQQGSERTEFGWRKQQWTQERVQKSLSKSERAGGQQEILDIPTPFDVTYYTPQSAPSPGMRPPDENQNLPVRNTVACSPSPTIHPTIRLRWKGLTLRDLDNIRDMAREYRENDDFEDAEQKYRELLDAAKHLLPLASEVSAGLAYEAAIFHGQNEEMEKADEVLDDLSTQFTQRWGQSHDLTTKHYSVVGSLLATWGRHQDAINVLRQLTNNFTTSVASSRSEQEVAKGHTPRPGSSYVHVDPSMLRNSMEFVANSNEETNPSASLAVLREQVARSSAFAVNDNDDDNSVDKIISNLIQRMDENREENGTDIIRGHCLLFDFYNRAELPEKSSLALEAAKIAARSLFLLDCKRPVEFFNVCISVAKTLIATGEKEDGEQLLEETEESFVRSYGENHVDTISLLIAIGKLYQGLKNWDTAEPRFEQAYAACITKLGYKSQLTLNLERCLERRHYSSNLGAEDDSQLIDIISL